MIHVVLTQSKSSSTYIKDEEKSAVKLHFCNSRLLNK